MPPQSLKPRCADLRLRMYQHRWIVDRVHIGRRGYPWIVAWDAHVLGRVSRWQTGVSWNSTNPRSATALVYVIAVIEPPNETLYTLRVTAASCIRTVKLLPFSLYLILSNSQVCSLVYDSATNCCWCMTSDSAHDALFCIVLLHMHDILHFATALYRSDLYFSNVKRASALYKPEVVFAADIVAFVFLVALLYCLTTVLLVSYCACKSCPTRAVKHFV